MQKSDTPRKLAVLVCGVFEWNLDRIRQRLRNTTLLADVLPAGLHANPQRLRDILQEKIDALQNEPDLNGIVIGYGVCGRGTIGLISPRVPLVMPRAQDCIGVFLGSHERYLQEFAQRPGTRYMTQGWYDSTTRKPKKDRSESYYSRRDHSLYAPDFTTLENAYGYDNACFICKFRESWKENYQRSAYIRFPGEDDEPEGLKVSRGTAESLNWEHEVLAGDESLLEALLNGDWDDPRVLVVPSGYVTVSAPGSEVIAYTSGAGSRVTEVLANYNTGATQAPDIRQEGIGLGIDTGGTFTDGVIYDFATGAVLASAKSPTTHDDLIVGIRETLNRLPRESLEQVRKVGISTTLATNAVVERKGRKVGVLIMTPFRSTTSDLPFEFVRKIQGTMSIEGSPLEEIDPQEVRRVAAEIVESGCEAVAVSGFAGVVNPAHEKEVASIIHKETGLHTVCGHELTTALNFVERATTAAMNAKLIPPIELLLDAVGDALREAGLGKVSVMIMKGDGSLMLDRVARQLPVQTILSGPAASVIGAAALFDVPDALVVDMGGTTLDVAVIRNRAPVASDRGARVGTLRTSVRSMETRTIGLGGDSEIDLSHWPDVRIGPRRIVPISRMTGRYPETATHIPRLAQGILDPGHHGFEYIALAPGVHAGSPLLEQLVDGPRLIREVAKALDRPGPGFIPWEDEETRGRIVRFGLTLTDIMHADGRFLDYDRQAALDLLDSWATVLDVGRGEIIEAIDTEFRAMVANEFIGAVLPRESKWENSDDLRRWLCIHLSQYPKHNGSGLSFDLGMPLIPVGAPAHVLFPPLADAVGRDILVSEHAGVANALGAICGQVILRETATIRITGEGAFHCSWRGGAERSSSLEEALEQSEQAITQSLQDAAVANRVPFSRPMFQVVPLEARTPLGTILISVTLTGELHGICEPA